MGVWQQVKSVRQVNFVEKGLRKYALVQLTLQGKQGKTYNVTAKARPTIGRGLKNYANQLIAQGKTVWVWVVFLATPLITAVEVNSGQVPPAPE